MFNSLRRRFWGIKQAQENIKTGGKIYIDLDNKRDLKSVLNQAPTIRCPNPACMTGPIIEKERPDNILIYLEDGHIYYCPCCERSYKYEQLTNNMTGFDDDGIDVSQSTGNPVNDTLKSNTIIRMFDVKKDNKVNRGHYSNNQKQRDTHIRELYDKEITKQYAKDNKRIDPL